ncbi:uncharacterized protein BDW47DRAFT_109874 [Aspergillus candidus]|uniref:Uncharacterized protein n=1 Tax=Aspergillus candidus TaxID=41067 RepID=A0A2I2F5H5_ASPCN|nr:hypothetical protein BDW47DRAFT_109874 [Aspergillus candidus]PLB35816.1 hypothetical protein BDW47DRAFT_109874 [Aspergillus candidus]
MRRHSRTTGVLRGIGACMFVFIDLISLFYLFVCKGVSVSSYNEQSTALSSREGGSSL